MMIRTILTLCCLSSAAQADGLALLQGNSNFSHDAVFSTRTEAVPLASATAERPAPSSTSKVRAALRRIEPAIRTRHSDIVESGIGLRIGVGRTERPLLGVWARF
ncbi:MAG: hypothetical protein ACU0DW_11895 [Shimia sp.]